MPQAFIVGMKSYSLLSDYRVLRCRAKLQPGNSVFIPRQVEGEISSNDYNPIKVFSTYAHSFREQIKVGVNDTIEMVRDDKSVAVNFNIME